MVSVESLAYDFSFDSLEGSDFSAETHSVMVVLRATGPMGATVNMLAPIVVNVQTRIGQQSIAMGGAEVPFILRQAPPKAESTPAPSIAANETEEPRLALASNG